MKQDEGTRAAAAVNFADDLSQSSDGASLSQSQGDLTTDTPVKKDGTSPVEQMQALFFSRVVVACLLVVLTTAAGLTTFFVASKTQEQYLETQFDDVSHELLNSASYALENALGVFATMSTTMSSLYMSSSTTNTNAGGGSVTKWPFYTQSDFAAFGQSFLEASGATMVSWSPIVSGEVNRRAWGNYSSANDAWVEEGLVWQVEHLGLEETMPQGPFNVPDQIYTKDDPSSNNNNLASSPEAGSGPFAPVWQMAGAPTDASVVNYNLLSEDDFKATFNAAVDQGIQTISKIVYDAAWYYGESALPKDGVNGPQGFLVTPLFEDVSSSSAPAVGSVVAAFSWDAYFKNVLQSGTPKVTVVVGAAECGGTFTFAVDGQQVTYLGEGDLHNQDYDDLEMSITFGEDQTAYMDCTFSLKVNPSQQFVEAYVNNEPMLWTLFVVGILVLTSVVFFVYDLFAQKRQFKYLTSAAKSNAIVSSLFPAEVRDRLFGKDAANGKHDPENYPESSKFRLQSYLSTENNKHDGGEEGSSGHLSASENLANGGVVDKNAMAPNASTGVDMYETKPIADLFPNTTIMFADIAGFTAWSSVREPSQVFTLLESVYSAFDAIAKRRKVFKVETVGDCYVAVAGLPEPRADHALVMAKFSKECLDKFNELVKQLEVTLGPDTADLAMRAGLHSGPVTAGVLRGDKSRFQLFGDTVNVAARIEHTGLRNRVHLSQDTADLLQQGGKEHWTVKRSEMVSGKGKSKIQTYWLHSPGQTHEDPDKAQHEQKVKTANKNLSLDEVEDALAPKVKRLVGWNVEILQKLLQLIIAKRNTTGNKRNYDAQLNKMEAAYSKRQYLLDEVIEIIALPKFDVKHHNIKKGAVKAEIPEKVVEQLKLYVAAVAVMHQDNPFHNFEHASHVTMSVSKLLARIVAPDEILNQEEDAANMAESLHDHTYGITSDPLTQFGCVLSALIHDTDHAGVSNFQLIKEKNKMATFFKEKSVAEQNSVILAWDKLMDPRFEDLRRCIYAEPSELDRFRQLLVNNVLATDIFDKELQALRRNRWEKAFQRVGRSDSDAVDDINRKATVVMEHLIQASDVAHTMQHWHIYQKWNERLFAEMTAAYQAGRMGSDPSENWYQGELGFFDNYIIPLANKLKECGVFGVSSDEYLNYALENRREWANKGEEVVEKYKGKYCALGEEEDEKED